MDTEEFIRTQVVDESRTITTSGLIQALGMSPQDAQLAMEDYFQKNKEILDAVYKLSFYNNGLLSIILIANNEITPEIAEKAIKIRLYSFKQKILHLKQDNDINDEQYGEQTQQSIWDDLRQPPTRWIQIEQHPQPKWISTNGSSFRPPVIESDDPINQKGSISPIQPQIRQPSLTIPTAQPKRSLFQSPPRKSQSQIQQPQIQQQSIPLTTNKIPYPQVIVAQAQSLQQIKQSSSQVGVQDITHNIESQSNNTPIKKRSMLLDDEEEEEEEQNSIKSIEEVGQSFDSEILDMQKVKRTRAESLTILPSSSTNNKNTNNNNNNNDSNDQQNTTDSKGKKRMRANTPPLQSKSKLSAKLPAKKPKALPKGQVSLMAFFKKS
ncbi:MAG: hypothetical protein EZS28_022330 [Streblomastix strix]|uniref:DNA polymerase delta subunit 3 n=1 Tax=Streblomastix strix TaxID=222440 RepID=A0A5J4VI55_9EUKA|nr:MAG: hypothetical protein EZS28_022330 [Streblomastix strix]